MYRINFEYFNVGTRNHLIIIRSFHNTFKMVCLTLFKVDFEVYFIDLTCASFISSRYKSTSCQKGVCAVIWPCLCRCYPIMCLHFNAILILVSAQSADIISAKKDHPYLRHSIHALFIVLKWDQKHRYLAKALTCCVIKSLCARIEAKSVKVNIS